MSVKSRIIGGLTGEGQPMPYYRLYFLDETGHIWLADPMDCDDDDAAIAAVEAHRAKRNHLHAMELWQQGRRVKQFPPRSRH